jgi:hypothetical protein
VHRFPDLDASLFRVYQRRDDEQMRLVLVSQLAQRAFFFLPLNLLDFGLPADRAQLVLKLLHVLV